MTLGALLLAISICISPPTSAAEPSTQSPEDSSSTIQWEVDQDLNADPDLDYREDQTVYDDARTLDAESDFLVDPDLELEDPSQTIEPMTLPNGFTGKSGVAPTSLAMPEGNGSIQGMGESFSPSLNTGSGTFSIPIAIPPGRRGLQPQIGLAYTTGAGNGILGWGWNMGVPSITRQTDKGIPRYDSSDRFMYNGGQELVPVADATNTMPSEEGWPAGWDPSGGDDITYYRARVEGSFMRFFFNRTQDTWLVQDRQGNHYYFGEVSGERISHPSGETFQWVLSRMSDVRNALGAGGNDVLYRYMEDGNNLYIQDIYWNSHGANYGRGNEADYQHNIHMVYEPRPDVSHSYSTGFRMEQNLRLRALEVASFKYAPSGSRPLTRVYLFDYKNEYESFHSRLEQVQMCGNDWVWDSGTGDGTGTCMPPLTLQYSQTEDLGGTASTIPGFGKLNTLVQDFANSPPVSVEDPNVDLLDVNQDGLPDVYITLPNYNGFGSDHAVLYNDGLDFSTTESTTPEQIGNPAGWSLNLQNMNVQVLDMDGTGNADLLHMPYALQYHYYRLVNPCEQAGTRCYQWDETPSIPANPAIDFTSDAMDIRLVDLNNDHLIDIVRTTGTQMEHFLNLSADPAYLGQFGKFDSSGNPVPNQSIDTCVLMRGSPMQFHNGNLQFGDMNGDGLQDLVDLKSGNIAYWPNRGYGKWGDTEVDCSPGQYVDYIEREMNGSPWFSNPDNEGVQIADVNGDGLADLVQIRFDEVDVWLNRGDDTFTSRHIIENTPYVNSGQYGRVRMADMNGSGTVDIVWADAGGWKYIDLGGDYRAQTGNGGLPAGLLEQVDNGLGATTLMEYATTTELMVDAAQSGNAWETVAPMAMTVIRKVIGMDNLDAIGETLGRYVQEFFYANPFYDAHEAEFKGFGYAEAWDREIQDTDGDGDHSNESYCGSVAVERGEAPIVSRNWFHRGVRPECMEPPTMSDGTKAAWPSTYGPHSEACIEALHEDNPLLGLTGASIYSDVYSPCTGKVMTATVSETEVRLLGDLTNIDPSDDRSVWYVLPNQGRVYSYDLDEDQNTVYTAEDTEYTSVVLTDTTYPSIPNLYRPVANLGDFHMVRGETVTDNHGSPTEAYYNGFKRYNSAKPYDHANCDQYTEFYSYGFDPSTWVHWANNSYMVGPSPEDGTGDCLNECTDTNRCNDLSKTNNTYGELVSSSVNYRDYDGTPSTFTAVQKAYNSYGQVITEEAGCYGTGCMRTSHNVYTNQDDGDLGYSAYIRKEILELDSTTNFTFNARWNPGLAQIEYMQSADGAESAILYDELGRFSAAFGPRLDDGSLCTASPTKWVEYSYGSETSPISTLTTHINTSQVMCGHNVTGDSGASSNRWEMLYTFVDSLGKPFAALAPGDGHVVEDAEYNTPQYPWVINGRAYLNAKGAAYSSCEGAALTSVTTNPSVLSASLGTSNCSLQKFDAYGRPTQAISPDGITAFVDYGLDEVHSWDHLDQQPTDPNYQTYSTQRVDGLGRNVASIVRYKNDLDAMMERWTMPTYGGVGSPVIVTQFDLVPGTDPTTNKIDPYTRRAEYDSMGRVRINMDMNFGQWEYIYNDVGELMEAVTPAGDRLRYTYDGVGRLIIEEFAASATPTVFETEAEYFYDSYPSVGTLLEFENAVGAGWSYPSYNGISTLGRLIAVKDRSGTTVSAGDFGSKSETWRQVFPDESIAYHWESVADYAGQLVYSEDPDGHRSTASYYSDGTGRSTFFTDDSNPTKYKIVDYARSNILGQTEIVKYGDSSETMVWNGYNPVNHQTKTTVVQQQNSQYTGAPTNGKTTLMAYSYEYGPLGKLTGIVDWRGRPDSAAYYSGLQTASSPPLLNEHPTDVAHSAPGYYQPGFPSSFDGDMSGPTGLSYLDPTTLWPLGAVPSDAKFEYDTLYQLRGEDREYVSNIGQDGPVDGSGAWTGGKRIEALDWSFDTRGSMTKWEEDETTVDSNSQGRALGSFIQNGWQLNESAGGGCNNWLESNSSVPTAGTCYLPDAIYFANNLTEAGAGRGTCTWVEYDSSGRMTKQTIRTGCTTCEYRPADSDKGVAYATCGNYAGSGTSGTIDYDPPILSKTTRYEYIWNVYNQLTDATRYENNSEKAHMSYVYDSSGGRVIRQKDRTAVTTADIYQDLYLGGYERRAIQMQNSLQNPVSVFDAAAVSYADVEGTRLVKYASGARFQWKIPNGQSTFDADPQIFLTFSNHLGSTSAVTDYTDGTLVEWKTNYAYGADESGWKNGAAKYDNTDEPYGFTGKEEDDEVGLHYFGSRYYSSHLGRWLSPDPPVVHGGGLTNHYNYGANSPYIYVDPDGNFVQAIVGAVVGAVTGAVSAAINGGGAKEIVLGAVVGAATGALTGGAVAAAGGGAAGVFAGAGASAACSMVKTAAYGGNASQIMLAGGVSFGAGVIGGGIGASFRGLEVVGQKIAGYITSLAVSYGAAAASGGLNGDTWDEILISASINFTVSTTVQSIGKEIMYLEMDGMLNESSKGASYFVDRPLGPPPTDPGNYNGTQTCSFDTDGSPSIYDRVNDGPISKIANILEPDTETEEAQFKTYDKIVEKFREWAESGRVANVPSNWSETGSGRQEALYALYLKYGDSEILQYAHWVVLNWTKLHEAARRGKSTNGWFTPYRAGQGYLSYFRGAYKSYANTASAQRRDMGGGDTVRHNTLAGRRALWSTREMEKQYSRLPTKSHHRLMHGDQGFFGGRALWSGGLYEFFSLYGIDPDKRTD